MIRTVICARGGKATNFLRSFLQAHADREHLMVYIDREENVSREFDGELADICRKNNAPFENPKQKALTFSPADLVISVGWRFLLDAPRLWVVHDSLLPKYRGFNPLVTALLAGDRKIGVSLIKGVDKVDAGPILLQKSIEIDYPITLRHAYEKLGPIYEEFGVAVAQSIKTGHTPAESTQDETQVTYSVWRDVLDYQVDWKASAKDIRRFVDAVGDPYLGATTTLNAESVRILSAEEEPDLPIVNRTPGKVFSIDSGKPLVICGTGLLRIHEAVDANDRSLLPMKKLKSRFA
jgi:methionyl-tRNA formyltransferase